MTKVLVTGGAGYIGSHVCKELARQGYTPIAFDNLIYGHEAAVRWGPLEVGDIRDRRRLDSVFEKYRPTVVMHFAAFAYVGESVQHPGKYYNNNVGGSLSLLEAMRDHKVVSLIFSSTCATYGVPSKIPVSESCPQRPVNAYGKTKLIVEGMLADFEAAHGLCSTSLRYFNAAGADPEGEIGEDHDPETHLVPLVLEAATGKSAPVTILGTDYDTPDGTCIRDYIHVTDLAMAHLLALKRLETGAASTVYNLGNGCGFSVREVIRTAEYITGKFVPVIEGARRAGDPPRLVGDAGLALKELGWRPRYSDLGDIVRTAWSWTLKRA